VLAAIVPASFQYVGEPNQVGFHIGMGVNERIPHAWLSPEVDDIGEPVPGEEGSHAMAIRQIQPGKPKVGVHRQPRQTRFFQGWIVVGVEVVQADDRAPFPQQPVRDMVADESGRAGDEDGRRRHHGNSLLFLRVCAGGSAANSTMRHLAGGVALRG
jgi:hypothetical protein